RKKKNCCCNRRKKKNCCNRRKKSAIYCLQFYKFHEYFAQVYFAKEGKRKQIKEKKRILHLYTSSFQKKKEQKKLKVRILHLYMSSFQKKEQKKELTSKNFVYTSS